MSNVAELAAGTTLPCDRLFWIPLVNCDPKGGGEKLEVHMNMVLFLSFIVNCLLLLGTNKLLGYPGGVLRSAMGAFLGAAYAFCCLLPEWGFLGDVQWRICSLIMMGIVAFGWNKNTLYRCAVFFFLSMAMGGVTIHTERKQIVHALLCAVFLWEVCVLSASKKNRDQDYQVLKLTLGSNTVSMLALVDTGNTLTDPVTGRSVVVISSNEASRLTGLSESALGTPLETMTRCPIHGLRLIPYRTIGGQGMLLGMRIKEAELDGRKRSILVAFAPERFGEGNVYQALTGGAL